MNFKEIEEIIGGITPEEGANIFKSYFEQFQKNLDTHSLLEDDTTGNHKHDDGNEITPVVEKDEITKPYFQKNIPLNDKEIEKIVSDLKNMMKHNLHSKAIESIDKIVYIHSRDKKLLKNISEALLEYNEIRKAVDVLFVLFQLYFEHRDLDKMYKILKQILSIDPTNRRALNLKEKLNL